MVTGLRFRLGRRTGLVRMGKYVLHVVCLIVTICNISGLGGDTSSAIGAVSLRVE